MRYGRGQRVFDGLSIDIVVTPAILGMPIAVGSVLKLGCGDVVSIFVKRLVSRNVEGGDGGLPAALIVSAHLLVISRVDRRGT